MEKDALAAVGAIPEATVIVSFSCELDIPGKREAQLTNCFY